MIDVNKNLTQELQLVSGAFNAEYGQAMSGIVNIATREGGPKFSGGVGTYIGQYWTNGKASAVNGEKIRTSRELTARAATLPVGETTTITLVREGKERTVDVKVAKRPVTVADAGKPPVEKEGEYGLQATECGWLTARQIESARRAMTLQGSLRPRRIAPGSQCTPGASGPPASSR